MRRTTRTFRLALALTSIGLSSLTVTVVATPALAAPASASTYTVVSGDTLYGIARKLGVSLNALLAANGMSATSTIHPGTVLTVPAGATAPAATSGATGSTGTTGGAAATTHTIVAGDTISGIARRYGLKYGAILKANTITLDSVLVPGRTLIIPAGGTPVVSPTPAPSGQVNAAKPTAPAAAPAAGGTTHTIVAGDTISGIAARYGHKYGAILKANGITLQTTLIPGRTLIIPPGGTPAAAATPAQPQTNASADATSAKVSTVVAYAQAQLGKPWKFAAAGPDAFDCSGLTRMAYAQIGISLPHSSVLQANRGVAIDWTTQEIQAGDLVFTATSDTPGVIGHVGIAIDAKRWIHSPRLGDVVRMGFIPSDAKILAVRRFVTG